MVAFGPDGAVEGGYEALVSGIGAPGSSGCPLPRTRFRTPALGARPDSDVLPTGSMGGVVEGGAHGTPPQAHPLGPTPSSDGAVPEEVDLATLRMVSGRPHRT
ncbi:hypothetical protein GCM10010244_07910 [Streptomyces coeruleorubidus]|nr:hypothetical protein GCM10010244_07910 [Streptomyces bellus]